MPEKIKATVLVDNNAVAPLNGEWGLSVYIQTPGATILLDTGATDLFVKNAAALGCDLSAVDYAVLSHAHYDHAGGIAAFFAQNRKADFYFQKAAGENCYHKKCYFKLLFFKKYIGIPKHIEEKYADRITYVSGDTALCSGIYLIPHHTDNLDAVGRREKMFLKTDRGFIPDDFSHEQSLVFDTPRGLVIFNSCSHGGAAVIIREVAAVFPDKKVYGLIGGFHLFNKSEDEIRTFARDIKETGIAYVCTGHCTKERAYTLLKEELGDTLHALHVGMVMEF